MSTEIFRNLPIEIFTFASYTYVYRMHLCILIFQMKNLCFSNNNLLLTYVLTNVINVENYFFKLLPVIEVAFHPVKK